MANLPNTSYQSTQAQQNLLAANYQGEGQYNQLQIMPQSINSQTQPGNSKTFVDTCAPRPTHPLATGGGRASSETSRLHAHLP